MIFFTSTLRRLFPAAQKQAQATPAPSAQGREDRNWTVEAHGQQFLLLVPAGLELGPALLARLTAEIEQIRRSGFDVLLSCDAGRALESLSKVRFHRFIDILPNRSAALRFIELGQAQKRGQRPHHQPGHQAA